MRLSFFIFVCLVAASWAAPGSKPKLRPSRLAKTANNVCTTAACQEAASSIKLAMDTSADPCDDFFAYACGNYPNSIPYWTPNYNRFAKLEQQNLQNLQAIFEGPHDPKDPAMYKKVKDYYASCVDTDGIQQQGVAPLLRLLKRLGGWPVIEQYYNEWTTERWTDVLYKLWQSGVGYNYVYDMQLGIDFSNNSYKPVALGFPEMTLSVSALINGPMVTEYNQHLNTLVRTAEALGADPYQATNDMKNVLNLERALYQASVSSKSEAITHDILTGPAVKIGKEPKGLKSNFFSTDYARVSKEAEEMRFINLNALQSAVPSINWALFFKTALQADNLNNFRLVTANANYLVKAIEILNNTPKRTVVNYLLLRAILDTEAALAAKEYERREVICTDEVIKQLPLIVGSMYLNKIFKHETKEVADEMVAKLRTTFQKRMARATWMDEETRKKAIDKLMNVLQDVAYLKENANTPVLQNLHQSIIIRADSYYENKLATLRFLRKMEMFPFGTSHKVSDWYRKASTVTIVNANYHPLVNAIWLPAGILQGAFFDAGRPQSMNFGGIGAVIGHEFTHGFDNKGRQFTKDGTLEEWWSATTIKKFDDKAQCLVDQFSSEYVSEIGQTLNGEQTVGENIADNGGFRQAYEAYLNWMNENEPEPLLPGLDFNHKQLFWLSNANVWCDKISPGNLQYIVQKDEHSPNKYRIKLGFQNFEEFANDFGCKSGSPMNPVKKCSVW